ncbi:TolB family protein [Candidatus Poriferisodalis sp.]|uniref:TolB family protein n=1 Tax=Candidatus Poriferisodalis sp. TaxID=3101277 RepID=UPI003B02C5E2
MVVSSSGRRGPDQPRTRWWLVAAVAGVLLVAAAAVSSQLGSNGAADDAEPAEAAPETSADAVAPDEDAAPVTTAAAAEAPVESEPPQPEDEPTDTTDASGSELSEAFGEPEHPVSGVEPYIPSRIRLDEPGPPADVCRGVLPAQRVQVPLSFASTKPEGVDHLSWSPDCRRMVFRVGSTLWVANGDGTSDLPFLTAQYGLNAPVWSPDSQWIAFSQGAIVEGERASHIFMILPNGLGLAQITHGNVLDQDPTWFPDEGRIAFARRMRVTENDGSTRFEHRIVLVDLLDGAEQVISASAESLSAPSWSPDGSVIAYRTGDELRMVRLDDLSESLLLSGVVGGRGTWSDDGSAIAAMREWSDGQATAAIRSLQDPIASEDYSVTVQATAEIASGSTPTLRWSETGEHLLFHAIDPRGGHWIYRLPTPRPDG